MFLLVLSYSTVIVAVSDFNGSAVDVAVIVAVVAVNAPSATVTSPFASTVATNGALEVHVTDSVMPPCTYASS